MSTIWQVLITSVQDWYKILHDHAARSSTKYLSFYTALLDPVYRNIDLIKYCRKMKNSLFHFLRKN